MSAYFSYLKDELAEIEERLCEADVAPLAAAHHERPRLVLAEREAKLAAEKAAAAAIIAEQAQRAA